MSTIRIKLIVQPYEERLCILVNSNSTITDLKGRVFDAIQFYSIYKDFLDFCTVHLELKIDNDLYFIPDNYVLSDCYESNDIFVVTFIENKQYRNRQSIHMKYQTKSDIQTVKKNANTNLSRIPPSVIRGFNVSSNLNKNNANFNVNYFDDGTSNINDIKEWIVSYLNNNGTLHAIYTAEYKEFMTKLQQKFANSIQNIFDLHSIADFESFLIQQCSIEIIKTQNGYNISYESPAIKNNKSKTKKTKNKSKNRNKALHPVLQNIPNNNNNYNNNNNNYYNKPRQPRRQPPPIPIIKNKKKNNKKFIAEKKKEPVAEIEPIKILTPPKHVQIHKKKPKEDLPSTPTSPSDDDFEDEKQEHEHDDDNTRKSPPPHRPRAPPPQPPRPQATKPPELPQTPPPPKHEPEPEPEAKIETEAERGGGVEEISEVCDVGEEILTVADMGDDDAETITEAVVNSRGDKMIALFADILVSCYKTIGTKYVLLNELERLIKTSFRDNTPYEFDIIELDYVCFLQLLTQKQLEMNMKIVNIEKRLMDKNCSNDIINGKCPEVETYVVINTKENESESDSPEITENIKYLSACNVVSKLSPNDVYYHLKLIHSQCSVDKLLDGVGVDNMNNINSFDEIARELRENNISGGRILEMKWSEWEMLHELSRYDRDHQDFVEDIVMDFFFPFVTGEQLSNQIVQYLKHQSQNPNQNEVSIFNEEQLRSKFTLCVDYGIFYNDANNTISPILHYFVKKCQLMDCNRLLLLHKNISVDCVMGEYSSMHIAAWRGKFKLLAYLTNYGGNPLVKNKKGETAFQAGKKYRQKIKWYIAQFPQFNQLQAQ